MTRRINYEDDIFTLALQVRCLQDTLKLEVDPELFRERILGDITWIDATIGRLYQSLKESSLFVKRQEHLKELQKLKRAFAGALDALVEKRAPFAVHIAEKNGELRAIRDSHLRDIEEIRSILAGKGAPEVEHMVSTEELKFLMTSTTRTRDIGSNEPREYPRRALDLRLLSYVLYGQNSEARHLCARDRAPYGERPNRLTTGVSSHVRSC